MSALGEAMWQAARLAIAATTVLNTEESLVNNFWAQVAVYPQSDQIVLAFHSEADRDLAQRLLDEDTDWGFDVCGCMAHGNFALYLSEA